MSMAFPALARTTLHAWHAAHGARFVEQNGWQVVASYGDPAAEAKAAQESLTLVDISTAWKVSIRGSDLGTVVGELGTQHATVLREGTIACRLTSDELFLIGQGPVRNASPTEQGRWIDQTSAYGGIMLLGAACVELMARLTHLPVHDQALPVGSCAQTNVAGVEALVVRVTELSVPSIRLYVAWDLTEFVWERLLRSGRARGIMPMGHESLDMLRRG